MGCTSSSTATTTKDNADNSTEKSASAAAAGSAVTNRNNHNNSKPSAPQQQQDVNNGVSATTTTTTTSANNDPQSQQQAQSQQAQLNDNDNNDTGVLHFGPHHVIQYACATLQGRDPDDASKPNQDRFSFTQLSEPGEALIGVYDGHGPTGHDCAEFVRQQLPATIQSHLGRAYDQHLMLTTHQIHQALHSAHVECNEQLHAAAHIDDKRSGTTAVTVHIQSAFHRVTLANVGDSRAILGTTTTTTHSQNKENEHVKWRAVPLSQDHTPYRPDEAARCRKHGARILSLGQLQHGPFYEDDSETEDPPRVWAPQGHLPGTAFTRSLGDQRAKQLGVHAEPELLTLKLTETEKMVILATDGVFDVLSNDQVVDICQGHYVTTGNPAHACADVLKRSHDEWKQSGLDNGDDVNEPNYDDMTLACLFFLPKDFEPTVVTTETETQTETEVAEPTTTTTESTATPAPAHHRKRVRQKTLHNLDDYGNLDPPQQQQKMPPRQPESQPREQEQENDKSADEIRQGNSLDQTAVTKNVESLDATTSPDAVTVLDQSNEEKPLDDENDKTSVDESNEKRSEEEIFPGVNMETQDTATPLTLLDNNNNNNTEESAEENQDVMIQKEETDPR